MGSMKTSWFFQRPSAYWLRSRSAWTSIPPGCSPMSHTVAPIALLYGRWPTIQHAYNATLGQHVANRYFPEVYFRQARGNSRGYTQSFFLLSDFF